MAMQLNFERLWYRHHVSFSLNAKGSICNYDVYHFLFLQSGWLQKQPARLQRDPRQPPLNEGLPCTRGHVTHGSTEWLGLEETSGDDLVQPACSIIPSAPHLQHIAQYHFQMHRKILNLSREGDSATSLGNLFQFSVSLTVFPHTEMELPVFQFVPVASCAIIGTTKKSLAPSS